MTEAKTRDVDQENIESVLKIADALDEMATRSRKEIRPHNDSVPAFHLLQSAISNGALQGPSWTTLRAQMPIWAKNRAPFVNVNQWIKENKIEGWDAEKWTNGLEYSAPIIASVLRSDVKSMKARINHWTRVNAWWQRNFLVALAVTVALVFGSIGGIRELVIWVQSMFAD